MIVELQYFKDLQGSLYRTMNRNTLNRKRTGSRDASRPHQVKANHVISFKGYFLYLMFEISFVEKKKESNAYS